jgi:hypothetical protein
MIYLDKGDKIGLGKVIIIPGVQKSGTTLLHDIISRSEKVVRPKIKETHYFAFNEESKPVSWKWYLNNFGGRRGYTEGSALIDSSTTYFYFPRSARSLARVAREPKVILLLRDPAKRAFSSFLHMKKRVPSREQRSFRNILLKLENSGTMDVKKKEQKLAKNAHIDGYLSDRHLLDSEYVKRMYNIELSSSFPDRYILYKYFTQSLYRRRYLEFKKVFGNNLKLVVFENLVSKTHTVVDDIYDFIGLTSKKKTKKFTKVNETRVPKNKIARLTIKARQLLDPKARLAEFFDAYGIRKWIRNKVLRESKPGMSEVMYNRTRELLSDEYKFWSEEIGSRFSLWEY